VWPKCLPDRHGGVVIGGNAFAVEFEGVLFEVGQAICLERAGDVGCLRRKDDLWIGPEQLIGENEKKQQKEATDPPEDVRLFLRRRERGDDCHLSSLATPSGSWGRGHFNW